MGQEVRWLGELLGLEVLFTRYTKVVAEKKKKNIMDEIKTCYLRS